MAVQATYQQIRDQVRAYRGLYERRQQFPAENPNIVAGVSFGDMVTAQQTLAGYLAGYLTALGQQWTAVVDVANVLQQDDLYQSCQPGGEPLGPGMDQLLAPAAKQVTAPGK
jgi:hypothetical protein